jgi:hypothetical protein
MKKMSMTLPLGIIAALAVSVSLWLTGVSVTPVAAQSANGNTPELSELDSSRSELRSVIERYVVDRGSLTRSYPVESSPARQVRFKQFYADWLALLGKMNFEALSPEGKVDYVLFKNHLGHEAQQLELSGKQFVEIAPLLPFAQTITDLAEARRRMEKLDSAKTAALLNDMSKQIEAARRSLETSLRAEPGKLKKTIANRTAAAISSLRNTLRTWYGYYNAYDPLFTWWMEEPYKAVDQSLNNYATFLNERVLGVRTSEAGPTMAGGAGGRGPGGGAPGGGGGPRGGGFGGGAARAAVRRCWSNWPPR